MYLEDIHAWKLALSMYLKRGGDTAHYARLILQQMGYAIGRAVPKAVEQIKSDIDRAPETAARWRRTPELEKRDRDYVDVSFSSGQSREDTERILLQYRIRNNSPEAVEYVKSLVADVSRARESTQKREMIELSR